MSSHAPLFITFTGNPLAETTMDFGAWKEGCTQRARSCSFQMGGKGVNVSKMLLRLGARTTALTHLGGAAGQQCLQWLDARGFAHLAAASQAPTRQGLVVRDGAGRETTFLGPDSPPDARAWTQLAADLHSLAEHEPHPVLAFCGSAPGWTAPEAAPFRHEVEDWLTRGRPVCVDTYGPPLAWFLQHPVELIKINADELAALCQEAPSTEERLALLCTRHPVKRWIVSDGPRPVWLAAPGTAPVSLTPPEVTEVSATGSGDVLLACLLEGRLGRQLSWEEALTQALPQASANAAHPGIAEF